VSRGIYQIRRGICQILPRKTVGPTDVARDVQQENWLFQSSLRWITKSTLNQLTTIFNLTPLDSSWKCPLCSLRKIF